jgi:hypothetical protein
VNSQKFLATWSRPCAVAPSGDLLSQPRLGRARVGRELTGLSRSGDLHRGTHGRGRADTPRTGNTGVHTFEPTQCVAPWGRDAAARTAAEGPDWCPDTGGLTPAAGPTATAPNRWARWHVWRRARGPSSTAAIPRVFATGYASHLPRDFAGCAPFLHPWATSRLSPP